MLKLKQIVIVPISVVGLHAAGLAHSLRAPLAAQPPQSGSRQRPIRLVVLDPTTRQQHGMRSHEFMRRRTRVHAGVVQDEILDLHEFARAPQGRASVVKMGAQNEGFRDRTGGCCMICSKLFKTVQNCTLSGIELETMVADAA
jgi:hypothetical protein